ncbi:hypothetical protein CAPTEDRAFT_137729, partial [Capitella teleta]
RILTSPRDTNVVEDGNVSFFCEVTGNPKPEIHWAKDNRRIHSLRRRISVYETPNGSVLRIERVRTGIDEGRYECIADSGAGTQATAAAMLNIYPKDQGNGFPTITAHPNLKAVENTRNTIMVCSASGNPKPQILWLNNFLPVNLTDPRLTLLESGSLQIRETKVSDGGRYECVAVNELGSAFSYRGILYVRVRRVPPLFTIIPTDVEVSPGDSANLTCAAVGRPTPYVRWSLRSVDLTPEDAVPLGFNVLELNDIWESGTYTCIAASYLGVIQADVRVEVIDLPETPVNVTISEVTATSVKLTWSSHNVDPTESYSIIYRQRFGLGSDSVYRANVQRPEFTANGLSASTQYEFRVSAVNKYGRGEPSESVHVMTVELR